MSPRSSAAAWSLTWAAMRADRAWLSSNLHLCWTEGSRAGSSHLHTWYNFPKVCGAAPTVFLI